MNVREALDNIYKEFEKTYEEAKKEGREQGLEEAWEVARKIAIPQYRKEDALTSEELNDIFGIIVNTHDVFDNYTVQQAMEKIEEYEEKQNEIKVGDELTGIGTDTGHNCIVVADTINGADYHIMRLLFSDGSLGEWEYRRVYTEFKKTGRHFPQIAEVLMQMKEEECTE